jgi:hypothetical protein
MTSTLLFPLKPSSDHGFYIYFLTLQKIHLSCNGSHWGNQGSPKRLAKPLTAPMTDVTQRRFLTTFS